MANAQGSSLDRFGLDRGPLAESGAFGWASEQVATLQQLARLFFPPSPAPVGQSSAGAESAGQDADRQLADAQLRRAEARYHTLVEQIPAVTFLAALDEGLSELYVSPQIEKLLGFSQQEWLENPILWFTQLHPEDREYWQEGFAATCATGAPFRAEYRFLARDGHVVWVRGECQIVRDGQGRPLFLQGTAFDITESKRAEESLRKMHADLADLVRERTCELAKANEALRAEILERRRLEEALRNRAEQLAGEARRKDHFLAILAHELRNPLAPIANALQILRQPGVQGANVEWAKDLMERQVRQMSRLIDDLLDVSRINQGKIALRKEEVDLATLISRAVEATRSLLTQRRHQLTVALSPEPLRLYVDPVRLDQVLVNLLNNAAKYTEVGGKIELSAARAGSHAVLRVHDTGIGIPAEMLDRIFDLFTQVDRSLASPCQWGLGIGLTLVRSLVEMHGGSIRALSAGPGQGSEFVVELPLDAARATAESGENPWGGSPTAPAAGLNVLIVDDNVDQAQSLSLLLRNWGHQVRLVFDGPTALATARAKPPEVILLDIGMPGMTGYEVAEQVRAELNLNAVSLIAISGYGREEDLNRSRAAGFDHHLVKPIDPLALRELLETSVGQGKP